MPGYLGLGLLHLSGCTCLDLPVEPALPTYCACLLYPSMQHKGSWRSLKGNEIAVKLLSHDLLDLLDKVFDLNPVRSRSRSNPIPHSAMSRGRCGVCAQTPLTCGYGAELIMACATIGNVFH